MKLEDLKNLLYDELTGIYESNCFNLNRDRAMFELEGKFVFWGTASEHSSSLTFRPRFSVSSQDYFNLVSTIFPDDRHFKSTIIVSKVQGKSFARGMSNSNWDDFLSYSLSTKEDLDTILKDHESFLTEVGLPFFELTASIQGIDIFLNKKILDLDISEFKIWEEQEKKNLMNSIGFKGVVAGLIASYLNSKNNFDLLILKFREFYMDFPFVLNYLEKTVTGLENIDNPT